MWEQIWESIKQFAMTAGAHLLGAILLLVIGWKLINVLLKFLAARKMFAHMDGGARTFLQSFLGIVLKVALTLTAAAVLGVPMTSMVALLGSAGLAVGLALQGSLSNLAGGLMILIFKPFTVGDFITTGEFSGTVQGINIFYTQLTTIDNRKLVIPNGTLSNQSISNASGYERRRLDLTFSTSYDADLETVKSLLLGIAQRHPRVHADPAPLARLDGCGESALNFVLRVWCDSDDYWDVRFDLLEQVKQAFDEQGIEIPFPQMDVHLTEEKK